MTIAQPQLQPGDNQVILGRPTGTKAHKHSGNKRLAALIQEELQAYAQAPNKSEKSFIIQDVLDAVTKWNNGKPGFVKLDKKTGQWQAAKDSVGRIMVAQSFRDALSDRYSSSKVNKQRTRQRNLGYLSDEEETCGGSNRITIRDQGMTSMINNRTVPSGTMMMTNMTASNNQMNQGMFYNHQQSFLGQHCSANQQQLPAMAQPSSSMFGFHQGTPTSRMPPPSFAPFQMGRVVSNGSTKGQRQPFKMRSARGPAAKTVVGLTPIPLKDEIAMTSDTKELLASFLPASSSESSNDSDNNSNDDPHWNCVSPDIITIWS